LRGFSSFSGPYASPQFFIQGAGSQSPSNYLALNSQQVAQGRQIDMIDNTSTQQMRIGDTFAEREALLQGLQKLAYQLLETKNAEENKAQAWEARKLIDKVIEEIKEEPKP